MKLLDNLYMVASGDVGLSLTSYLDCNVYLINAGGELILIDSGSNYEPHKMDTLIESLGFSLEQIKIILLTHYHADHAGGAARLKELTGCAVYASAKEADAIITGNLERIGLTAALKAGYVYPKGYTFRPCPDVRKLSHGDTLSLNGIIVKALAVPGHSLEGMVYYVDINGKYCLFTGDSLFPGGKIMLQNLPDVSIYSYYLALKNLGELDVDAFFPGHREPSLNRGKRHIEAALNQFEKLVLPPQFL